jgi:hypothetical protein
VDSTFAVTKLGYSASQESFTSLGDTPLIEGTTYKAWSFADTGTSRGTPDCSSIALITSVRTNNMTLMNFFSQLLRF